MRIKKILSIAINTPPQILLKEALRKCQDKTKETLLRKRALSSDLSISNVAFLNSLVDVGDFETFACKKREDKAYLLSNFKEIRPIIENNFLECKKEGIHWADEICSHRFDILGSGKIDLVDFLKEREEQDGSYLPWHWDFKNGFKWDRKTFYRDISFGKIKEQDVKVPWELSRFQHLVPLGQAYVLTGDEKYTREFIEEVDNWIDCNPYLLGVNWACTMDVAIRVANWLIAWSFFRKSQLITDDFIKGFFKSILQHGRFIRANLEWSEILTSNHYLSNIVGLLFLGIFVPEFKESEEWNEFALKELIKEMEKQVYEDGTDFEASTCYHRLVLELFFFPALLCKKSGIELPERFLTRLKKMFDVVLHTLKPNGRIPQIGDNDNGRLHIFSNRELLDMTYLLTFGSLFFDEPKYKVEGFAFAPEALWLFGEDAYARWLAMTAVKMENVGSRGFCDGGLYIMRHERDYMIVSCGPNGQKNIGVHAHNDKLSFELSVDGTDIIVDSGTYLYTPHPEWRNLFRSTAFHNTVMINGEEQNRFYPGNLFSMYNDSRARNLKWQEKSDEVLFTGEHYGYERLKNPICHKRTFKFLKQERRWEILDSFYYNRSRKGEWNLTWQLILFPGLKVKDISKGGYLVSKGTKGLVKILLPEGLTGIVRKGWYSEGYGVKSTALFLKFSATINKLPRAFPWSIEVMR